MNNLRETTDLRDARQAVKDSIAGTNPSWDTAIRNIRLWKNQLKLWADQETLMGAFAEGRLTIRTMSHGSYKGSDERQKITSIIDAGGYGYSSAHNASRGQPDGTWKATAAAKTTVNIDASGAGLKARLNPNNFLRIHANGRTNKNALGLHTLSASLLNPDFPMTLKYYGGSTLVAFMPLPLPKDVELFYALRRLSKPGGGSTAEFVGEVVILASEFTRPQLASHLDMGTVYAPATPQPRPAQPSYRYVKGDKGTSKESPEQCRTNAVNDYRTIIINGSLITRTDSKYCNTANAANEITVAYRKWGNTEAFPVFCISRSGQDVMEEVTMQLVAQQPSNYQATGVTYSKADLKIVLVA